MHVQIGICDVERELEIEVEDPNAFSLELEQAFANGTAMLWYLDLRGRKLGVPVQKIAYVAIETGESELSVGFG